MKYILWFKEMKKDDFGLVGGKGYNLGIMAQMKLPVPPGFNITTKAFDEFIEVTKIKGKIKKLIEECDVENTRELIETSNKIKKLIVSQKMPTKMKREIIQSYGKLSGKEPVFVAARSSATAEDLPSIGEDEYALVRIENKLVFDKMKNIYEKSENKQIFVPSLKDSKISWRKVQEIYKHKAEGNLIRLTTRSGRELLLTPNHSLIALDEKEFGLKSATIFDVNENTRIPVVYRVPLENKRIEYFDVQKCLQNEDILVKKGRIKTKKPNQQMGLPKKIKVDENFAYFLGIYAAEGSTYENCLDISCESLEIAEKIRKYMAKLLLKDVGHDKKNVRVFNLVLVKLLHKLLGEPLKNIVGKGKLARVKKVPNLIFNQGQKIICAFLKGCFDGDGYAEQDLISYTSVSKDLIAGIVTLLEFIGIKSYLRQKKAAMNIEIPISEAENFLNKIGSTEKRKRQKIMKFIAEYKRKRKHHDIIDTFPKNEKIAKLIENSIREKYMQDVETYICPYCEKEMIRNGKSSSGKQRFICKICKKSISSMPKKKLIERIITRDEKGRFFKGFIPWNIGKRQPEVLGRKFLQRIGEETCNDELKMIADGDVIWDKIKTIKRVRYSGYVYDFVVPETQNFLAGAGGIITHNTASFAGQQATFLNVKGTGNLVEGVKKCWASLYEPRAIFYRAKNKIASSSICVITQRMVNAEKSGVMFTINPTTDEDQIIIEACWGLGEMLVQGKVEPDRYIVSKKGKIIDKKIGTKHIRMIKNAAEKNIQAPVPRKMVESQVLTDREILLLAKYGVVLEKHYKKAQDVEFAIEKNNVYIVQTRAVTTEAKEIKTEVKNKPVLKGLAVSPGIVTGTVRIIHGLKDVTKVQQGDILVTVMTSPDLVPTMSKAAAIITDEGSLTCHAAIVSREMSIPCIVGTQTATKTLKDGQTVTVDAYKGFVYAGAIHVSGKAAVEMFAGQKTKTKIKVNLVFAANAEKVAKVTDGVGLLRIEHMITQCGIHPSKLVREGHSKQYIKILVDGIRPIAKAFGKKRVWVRTLDARSDEFRNLSGGKEEPHEDNPMLGWHGIRRSLDEPSLLRAEFEAIKQLHKEGYNNLDIMLPFVINVEELKKAKVIAKETGLPKAAKIGVMVETPAAALDIERFCKEGIAFVSFGSNDLSQLTLGVDRNNAKLASLFTEKHPAVLKMFKEVIKTCKKYGVETSICGEAPSNYPEIVDYLVKCGIDSLSVNIDAIAKVRKQVAEIERGISAKCKK